ncbi:MAG: AAA family ATPase [Clostridia bacterium]|nr:AAA family ATPase [Clostridia bacterium]
MKINKIKIDRFGGLSDFTLDFSDGLNLIFGQNEDGKTTVLSFLRLMFYGSGTKAGDLFINLRRRFTPFSGDRMGGEILFTHEGREYLLSKQFGKTQKSDKVSLIDRISGKPIELEGEVGEVLFGMSCAAFERSIFISQFTPAQDGSRELSARLASLAFSDDGAEDYNIVKDRIENAAGSIFTRRKVGTADRLSQKIDELENEKRAAFDIEARRKQNDASLLEIEGEIAELEAEKKRLSSLSAQSAQKEKKAELRAELSRRAAAAELKKTLSVVTPEGLATAEKKLHTASLISAEAEAKKSLLRDDASPTDDGISEKLELILNDIEEVNRRLSEFEKPSEESPSPSGNGMNFILAFLFAAAAAAGAAASLVFLALLAPAVLFAVLGITSHVKRAKAEADTARERLLTERKKSDLEVEKKRLNDDYLVLRERKKLSDEGHKKAENEQNKLREEIREKTDESARLENEARVLLGNADGDLRDELARLKSAFEKLNALKDWLSESPYRDLSLKEINDILADGGDEELLSTAEYDEEIRALDAKINRSHAAAERLRTETEELLRRTRGIGVLEIELRDANRALGAQKAHYDALLLAGEMLDEAYDEMRSNFAPELNRLTSELFERLTGGKHGRVAVSNDFMLTVSENGTVPYSAEFLSGGSGDQAELCLRLAVAKLTGGDHQLPLLLDDVLMQYDDARAAEATRFLADYARENQVLLFTCHGYFKELAAENGANVVNMK